ncbi:MAG: T9SS type A sorting domain-containing protein, partial [Muribaculaceae bacterium]|nr:T9SS type A sorting domain-containing protein [Muribaculaceae bacterium]
MCIFTLPLSSMGQSKDSPVIWVAADQGYANQQAVTNFVIEENAIEGLLSKSDGSSAPAYYTTNAGVRMYAKNTLSISTLPGYSLHSIEYVFKKQGSKTYATSSLISEGGTYVSATSPTNGSYIDTWTCDEDYKGTVTIKLGASGQRVLCQITVTYTGSAQAQYTVYYHSNIGNDNSVADPTSYGIGATVTVLSPSAALLNFTNPGNVFTKWSTSQDGQSGIDYLPGDQFTMGDGDVNLYAQWTSTTNTRIDELTPSVVNAAIGESTGYQNWTVAMESGAIYQGKSLKSDSYIQMTNSQSGNSQYSGIVTTTPAGVARRVQVVWHSETPVGRTLNVYAKNTAYTSTSNLYGSQQGTLVGTLVKGTSSVSEVTIADDYNYVGLLSASGAMYISKISITWVSGGGDTPTILMEPSSIALGNVVVYEDLQATFTVSQANLNTGITLTASKGELSTDYVEHESEPTQVTWSYTALGTESEFPVTITATSGDATATLEITATVLPSTNFTSLHESKAAFLLDPSASDVLIDLTDVEVVGQTGNYLYLQDADAGVLVYGAGAPTFEKGYKFSQGYLIGTYVSFNGITEITNFNFVGYEGGVSDLTVTTATVDQIIGDPVTYESRYVVVNNTSINNWTLPGQSNSLAFYDVFHTNYALCTPPNTEHTFTVKGMVNRHWSNQTVNIELAPTSLSDISTTTEASAPSITAGGTASTPLATTYVDITPGANSTAVYSLWRENANDEMELIVDNQRITSATNISIIGRTEIKVHGERDFYANSPEIDYWYDLPANTHSVQFSINGVIDPQNNVLVATTLSPTQTPNVTVLGDYGLLGWSTVLGSTEVIDLDTYTFTDNMILYAVYYKGQSFQYVKVNDVSSLTEGEYVITASSGSTPYTFKNNNASTPLAHSISEYGIELSGNQLVEISGQTANFEEITWTFTGTPNEMTIKSTAYPDSYLYTANENTGVRISSNVSGEVGWTIEEDHFVPDLFNLKCLRNGRYLALYNNQDWRSYLSLTVQNSYPRIALYKKTAVVTNDVEKYTRVFWNETATGDIAITGPAVIPSGYHLDMGGHLLSNDNASNLIIENDAVLIPASGNTGIKATVRKDIVGYGESNIAGWHLLSSPVGAVSPGVNTTDTYVDNLIASPAENYDLYGYDQSQELEWRNHKLETQTFSAQGGLLYATKYDRTIEFVGTITATATSQDQPSLVAGWNLIGNPFTSPGYLEASDITDYYRLEDYVNADDQLESHFVSYTVTDAVAPMEGVFVQATSANQTYYFNNLLRNNPSQAGLVNMTLTGSRGSVVDVARLRINNGAMMGKMTFKENSTKIYIPQGGKDYAVVRTQAQGELPLNFVAEADATYTLTFAPEAVEMEYFHLIDNLTGVDVDLLSTPSYTFEGRYSDYPSRFKLVFQANESGTPSESETFAYFNGSQWMVSNIGEATLQVIDVMGRIVNAKTISGNAEVSIDMPGVYVVRLINGNNVKIQK